MSLFDQGAALVSASVDSVYGETFTFIGMKAGVDRNVPRVLDTDRPPFDATGGFIDPSKTAFPAARGTANNQAQRHVVTEPFVSVDNAKLPWAVVTGDRATQKKTGAQYEVARALPDGVARTVIYLTAKASS